MKVFKEKKLKKKLIYSLKNKKLLMKGSKKNKKDIYNYNNR